MSIDTSPHKPPLPTLPEGAVVLSLDVFDTALTRCWARPEHVHLACAHRLREAGLIDLDDSAWFALRRSAEQQAVRARGDDLARLADIYALLAAQQFWTPTQSAQAQAIECDVELSSVWPVAALRQWWFAQAQPGRARCFLSDMYLPTAQLQGMLARCGYAIEQQDIWVSAQLGASKSSGALYRLVAESLGAKPASMMHVGDNCRSDVEQARRFGAIAHEVNAARLTRFEQRVAEAPQAPLLLRSIIAGSIKAARLSDQAPLGNPMWQEVHDFGRDQAGPLLTVYVWWLLHDAQAKNLHRLYFLSRDGQVLLEIARRLQAEGVATHVELRYLHGSRQAWFAASIIRWDEDEVFQILDEPHDLFNAAPKLAKRLGFENAQALEALWPQAAAACVGADNNRAVARALVTSVPATVALAHTERIRSLVHRYLQQEGLLGSAVVGIVDLGWRGRLQLTLDRILKHPACGSSHAPRLHGYYIALLKPMQEHDSSTLLDCGVQPVSLPAPAHLLEMLCEADHGSTRGYALHSGGFVRPLFDAHCDPTVDAWGLRAYRQGLLSFADVFAKSARLLPESMHERAPLEAMFHVLANAWMHHAPAASARAFARMPTTYSASHEGLKELAPALPAADAWVRAITLGRWRLSNRRTPWLAGSLARSGRGHALVLYGRLRDWAMRSRRAARAVG